MNDWSDRMREWWILNRAAVCDVVKFAGLAAIVAGVAMFSGSAAFIVGGTLAFAVAVESKS